MIRDAEIFIMYYVIIVCPALVFLVASWINRREK